MSESKYPEHDKAEKIKNLSQACGEFLEWLQDEKGVHLASYGDGELYQVDQSVSSLLAEFFGIDEKKLEAEKRAMLAEMRRANEQREFQEKGIYS